MVQPITMAIAEREATRAMTATPRRVGAFTLEPVAVTPIIAAFRSMVRELAYGISEMAPTTYLLAKSVGKPFTALPVFLQRKFHHADIVCRSDAGIRVPRDLEGRRVGVRAYSVTTGVWVRGLLASEYGVDLDSITWVTDDEEHVQEYVCPTNVLSAPPGSSLAQMLADGEVDAALTGNAGVGRAGRPRADWDNSSAEIPPGQLHPLFDAPDILERDWFLRTGIYPIHGLVVVRDDLLRSDASLAQSLYDIFEMAKDEYLSELGTVETHSDEDAALFRLQDVVGGDPLPYGVEANRASLEALVDFSVNQHLISETIPVDDMFAVSGGAAGD